MKAWSKPKLSELKVNFTDSVFFSGGTGDGDY